MADRQACLCHAAFSFCSQVQNVVGCGSNCMPTAWHGGCQACNEQGMGREQLDMGGCQACNEQGMNREEQQQQQELSRVLFCSAFLGLRLGVLRPVQLLCVWWCWSCSQSGCRSSDDVVLFVVQGGAALV